MIEEIFPEEVGKQARRNIQANKIQLINRFGFTQIVSNEPDGGLRTFSFNRRLLSDTDFNEVRDFFIVTQGEGVLFKDWKDYSISGGYIATGDASEDSFNLIKRYEVGSYSVDRRIFYPAAIDAVYFDDVEQVSGWSWNSTTKQIDFTSPPGDGVVITVDVDLFYVPVYLQGDLASSSDFLSVTNYEGILLKEILIDV